jgi:small subunit ribosomal protein S6
MRHYEVTFIVDPVLSSDEVKSTADHILADLKHFGATVEYVDEMGIRQLAFIFVHSLPAKQQTGSPSLN